MSLLIKFDMIKQGLIMKLYKYNLIFVTLFSLFYTNLYAQNNLTEQMKELNRLQAKLEAMQESRENSSIDSEFVKSNELIEKNIGRYQIVNMVYQSNVPQTNTTVTLKGPIKLDTVTGDTWRYVLKGYDEYWQKIEE